MPKELEILRAHLARHSLRHSAQRETILARFLAVERHVTAEELYDIVKRKDPGIGFATVHRSLKLFAECGLARQLRLGTKKTYYEHAFRHKHHDHLVCLECGRTVEFIDPTIEKLQEDAARRYRFSIQDHSLVIYGKCRKCR